MSKHNPLLCLLLVVDIDRLVVFELTGVVVKWLAESDDNGTRVVAAHTHTARILTNLI